MRPAIVPLTLSALSVWPAAVLSQDASLGTVSVYGERPAAFRNPF